MPQTPGAILASGRGRTRGSRAGRGGHGQHRGGTHWSVLSLRSCGPTGTENNQGNEQWAPRVPTPTACSDPCCGGERRPGRVSPQIWTQPCRLLWPLEGTGGREQGGGRQTARATREPRGQSQGGVRQGGEEVRPRLAGGTGTEGPSQPLSPHAAPCSGTLSICLSHTSPLPTPSLPPCRLLDPTVLTLFSLPMDSLSHLPSPLLAILQCPGASVSPRTKGPQGLMNRTCWQW